MISIVRFRSLSLACVILVPGESTYEGGSSRAAGLQAERRRARPN